MDDESRERTLFVTNIHDDVTADLLWELMVQAGPVYDVALKPRTSGTIAFVEFKHEESVPYAIALLSNVRLFGTALTLKARDGTKAAAKIAEAQRAERHERENRERAERAAVACGLQPQYTSSPYNHQQYQHANSTSNAQQNAYMQQQQRQTQQQPPVPSFQTPPLAPSSYQSPASMPIHHFFTPQSVTTPLFPPPYAHNLPSSQPPDRWTCQNQNTPPLIQRVDLTQQHSSRLQYDSSSQRRSRANNSDSFERRPSHADESYGSHRRQSSRGRPHPYNDHYERDRRGHENREMSGRVPQQRRNR